MNYFKYPVAQFSQKYDFKSYYLCIYNMNSIIFQIKTVTIFTDWHKFSLQYFEKKNMLFY